MCFHVNYAKILRKNIFKGAYPDIGGIYLITVLYIIKGFGICERNMLLVDQIST